MKSDNILIALLVYYSNEAVLVMSVFLKAEHYPAPDLGLGFCLTGMKNAAL